jgi:hypothetical protein
MSLYSRAETQAQSIKVLNTTEKASVAKYESDGTLVAHDGNTNATAGAEGNAAIQARVVFIDEVEATLAENTERGLNAPGWWQYTSYTDADGNTRHKCQHLAAFKSAPANTADSDDDVAADAASAITISAQPANQSAVGPEGGLLTVDTVSAAVATRPAGTYTIGASDYSTDIIGGGSGATFTITVDGTGAATIDSIDAAGSGFVVDETFTIVGSVFDNGTDPAGTDGVDDLTFDAATVAAATATFSVTAAAAPAGSVVYQWQSQTATGTRWTNISGATSASLALTGLVVADNGRKYRVKLTSTAGAEEVISNAATLTVTAA